MEKIYKKILENKYKVMLIFLVLFCISLYLATKVKINYDLSEYLPDDMQSKKAYKKYEQLFDNNIPNSRFVAKDVSITEALELKDRISEVKGVSRVIWLDDFIDVLKPVEMQNKEEISNYYNHNDAMFLVSINEKHKIQAVYDIKDIIGKDGLCGGSLVSSAMADTKMDKEIKDIFLIVIPLALFILLLTSLSWFEPLLFIVTTLIAIAINLGSNVMFYQISFITATAAAILQLAVSMDYSIFLLHKFSFYKKSGLDPKSAMLKSMKESALTIKASVLTTIIGFLALIFMKFRVGADMGIVMAKGIIISYITTIVLLPVLIMLCHKLIDKTTHKAIIPTGKHLVDTILKVKVPLFILTLILVVPTFLAQSNNDFIYGASNIFSEGTDVYEENAKIEKQFGKSNYIVTIVPFDIVKEQQLVSDFKNIQDITQVISYADNIGSYVPDEFVPENLKSQLLSGGYSQIISTIGSEDETEESFEIYSKMNKIAKKYYGDKALFVGSTPVIHDMKTVTKNDMLRVNLIAGIAIFIVLLLTMQSISLPIILLALIEISIWINLSTPYFQGLHLHYIGYLIIGAIQLGATVDYAILMANTYIADRKSLTKLDSLSSAVKKSTLTILTSASIFAAGGMVLGLVSSNAVILDLGKLIAKGASISALMVILVLPGVLYLFDSFIIKTTRGMKNIIR